MKRAVNSDAADAMLSEYDFSRGVKNPYAGHFAKGSNLVMIKPEIFAAFPSQEAVNEALGSLIRDASSIAGNSRTDRKKAV